MSFDLSHIIAISLIIFYFICFGKIFEKAGRNSKEGFIPFYNFFVLIKHILKEPWWWIFALLLPSFGMVAMFIVLNYLISIAYGLRTTKDKLIAIFLPHYMLYKVAFDSNVKYVGPAEKSEKKTVEWGNALVFALIAASIIRSYVFESYTIPTGSMEKHMRVGDNLFVSKYSYGPRLPMNPISFPLAHNTMPVLGTKSYLEWLKLPYFRIGGFREVKRNDVVVFNFPTGDTSILGGDLQGHNYYDLLRQEAYFIAFNKGKANDYFLNRGKYEAMARDNFFNKNQFTYQRRNIGWTTRPIDKRENYVKRCVALPGDTISIKDAILYVNGERGWNDDNVQYKYLIRTDKQIVIGEQLKNELKDNFNINFDEVGTPRQLFIRNTDPNTIAMYITNKYKDDIKPFLEKRLGVKVESITKKVDTHSHVQLDASRFSIYPNDISHSWTVDNFGPLWIPKYGETIELNKENWILYGRCISVYDENQVEVKSDGYYINGVKSSTYTFKQNYYWMMGDNRHNSSDSRMWGFVPENHIVGKAIIVWSSFDSEKGWFDGKIRWNRFFKLIH